MLKKIIANKSLTSLFLIVMISSCGPMLEKEIPNGQYVKIPIQINKGSDGESSDLNLIDSHHDDPQDGPTLIPSSYNMQVTGCQSGYTAKLTQENTSAAVFKGDQGCIVQLTSFVYNGATYIPKIGASFSTYLPSDSAVFVNQKDSTDMMSVNIKHQLSSSVTLGDKIAYAFNHIAAEEVKSTAFSAGLESHVISLSSQDPPAFNLNSINPPAIVFNGLDSSGAGQFQFNLLCSKTMTDGSGTKTFCPTISNSTTQGCDLTQITYKLVNDTYGVSTGQLLSESQVEDIFATEGTAINTSTDLLDKAPYGFKTQVLSGPAAMFTNPNTILILNCNNLSFQYFLLTSQTPH